MQNAHKPDKHLFLALDGLRGIAAIAVVLFHYAQMMGIDLVMNSYLAVDFFFLLSGFVIAHAYDKRMDNGLGFKCLMKIRLIRLYPLFLLGCTLPLISIAIRHALGIPHYNRTLVAVSYGFSLLMLPTPEQWAPSDPAWVFPLNIPAWSLSLEMAVNAFYAAFHKKLTRKTLPALMFFSAATLIAMTLLHGNMMMGGKWGNYLGGWPRVMWSFFTGLALYRMYVTPPRKPLSAWAGLVIGLLLMAIFAYDNTSGAFGLFNTVLLFPALVWLGARVRLGGKAKAAARWLGQTSYAVYITHVGFCGFLLLLHTPAKEEALPFVLLYTLLALIFAWLLDIVYDVPVRRWLARRFIRSN